jgi:hypothetical protein
VLTRPFCEIRHGGGRPTRENTGPEARVFQQPLASNVLQRNRFVLYGNAAWHSTTGIAGDQGRSQ